MKAEHRALLQELVDERREELEEYAVLWVHGQSWDLVSDVPTGKTRELVHGVFEVYLAKLLHDDAEPLKTFVQYVVDLRAGMLFHVSTPQRGFFSFRKALQRTLEETGADPVLALGLLLEVDDAYVESMHVLSDHFTDKLNGRIQKLYDDAQRASEAKGTFLASMSHEIRTPMNAILGYTQLLKRQSGLSDENRRFIEAIGRSGDHLLSLINDVLDMAKIEAGRVDIEVVEMDLDRQLLDIERMFQLRASEKGLELRVVSDESLPSRIRVDDGKVRQVLINLLGNALKFTDTGSVTLLAKCTKTSDHKGEVRVEIRDTGCGIPADHLESIFDPFAQSKAGLKRSGTGLGLTVSRQFAELLGGSLTVTSAPGEGSVFTFTFACELLESRPRQTGERQRVTSLRKPDGAAPRVLIIDDEETNLSMLSDMLAAVGVEARTANSGANGLICIEQELFDAVLLDLRMPEMDGHEVHRRLREHENGREIPVIFVSASAQIQDREKAIELGASAFVTKPVRESVMHQALVDALVLEVSYQNVTKENLAEERVETEAASPTTTLDAAQRAELLDFVRSGDVTAFSTAVQDLEFENAMLAARLTELIDAFDYDGIEALLSD